MQETPRKGSDTRERILDVAEAAVLEKGFAATSIEEVIAAVGITKSGFFYHFKDKNDPRPATFMSNESVPAFRSFTSNFNILMRDNQTAQYTTATDQVSGEVLKIDATLNVLK